MKFDPSSRPMQITLAALLLVAFAAQAALASPCNSAAFDEEYHLAFGYAYLRTGDPRLSTEHPPLVNVWNALPLFFLDPKLPLDHPSWEDALADDFGDTFLWQTNTRQAIPIVLLGRLPIMVLGALLGAILFRWTRDLFGPAAGLLALALYAFDPNLIAHSRLSTTDLGLALTMTLAIWRLWAWLEKPTHWNLVWVGVAAGAAIMTKFTGLMLAPMFLLTALVYPSSVPSWKGGMKWGVILRRIFDLAQAGVIALLVIWAVYGFEVKGGLPAATFWHGLIKVYAEYSQGYPAFLFGQISRTGWWYYFPVTFALKTPLPTLILCAIGALLALTSKGRARAAAALLPPALSMAAAMSSPLTIGYRHILPVLPFAILLAGNSANLKSQISNLTSLNLKLPHLAPRVSRFAFYALLLLVAWNMAGTISIFPHHLSYFNELAGGPANAHNILVDSNLDWGQDLPALNKWMSQNNIEQVNLSFFGTALPAVYGVRYKPLPAFLHFLIGPDVESYNPYTPEPGWYAISATSLRQGLMWTDPDVFAFFRTKTPVARASYSILIYHLADDAPGTPLDRAVVIGKPVYQVPPETLGVTPGHRLIAKQAASPDTFIFAMSGLARYVAPDPFPFDRPTRRAFRAAAQQDGDALVLDARAFVESRRAEWRGDKTLTTPDGRPVNWPAHFDGKLDLIGYRLESDQAAPGSELDLITYWQVAGALDEPLAYFVHIIDEADRVAGQYDGWGTARRALEAGDVIVQHIRLPIKPDAQPGAYRLQLGVYSTDDMLRWPVRTTDGTPADRVILSSITIAR